MYTVKQVIARLGISRSLCYREIAEQRLRVHRFGKRTYRVSEADLADYVARCTSELAEANSTPANSTSGASTPPLPRQFRHVDISRWLSSRS